ncbi:uncharacterized protein LOC111079229 isoform X1 [Drosophila obscura]|uniref:uncharacterized protein LOC111079229 isoform X1 n=1 Tax=Drosophila obscura TaxID=7282 RepID=UPI001BB1B5CA|nr:uncharacterized protein LOC111079229 isoform X1 [Drosophila obscura]
MNQNLFNYLFKTFLTFLFLHVSRSNAEISGLLSALQYFGLYGNGLESLGQSRGQCEYSFESFALLGDRYTCAPDDEHILHLTQLPPQRKPPIMIKCLQPEAAPDNGNGTAPKLLIMKSAKDIVNLLKPIGNATKRHEHGSCVVVHFCTATSLECSRVAPVINLLPHLFPTLPVAYIDAYEFTPFNAEFGIVSLPTLMIFHQGRPLIKYDTSWTDSEKRAFGRFIMRHTNVRTVDPNSIDPQILLRTLTEPLANSPEVQTDYYLGMAWAFILLCLANYVRGTVFWTQLVAMVQRNWRESEETQMDVVD